jgi:hypothetical protein
VNPDFNNPFGWSLTPQVVRAISFSDTISVSFCRGEKRVYLQGQKMPVTISAPVDEEGKCVGHATAFSRH